MEKKKTPYLLTISLRLAGRDPKFLYKACVPVYHWLKCLSDQLHYETRLQSNYILCHLQTLLYVPHRVTTLQQNLKQNIYKCPTCGDIKAM